MDTPMILKGGEDYTVMREFDVTLVWSPRSNLALYGETVGIAGGLDSGVLSAFGLSPTTFAEHVEGTVPVNDTSRQAPCKARH